MGYLCLDGTLIPVNRVAARTERGNNTWYAGKNRQFSGNVRVVSDPNGHPLWVSPVRPGSTHDLRCARELMLPTLYQFCRLGPNGHSLLPVLADKGYIGIGVRVPHRRPMGGQILDRDARTYNRLHAALRAPSERANALLQQWHALDRASLDRWPITKIAAAAPVLTRLQLPTR